MTPAERSLLLAVFRWARAEGGLVYRGVSRWTRYGPDGQRWHVDWTPDLTTGAWLTVHRYALNRPREVWAADIAEAVDLLVALGVLPARFSTAYQAGFSAYWSAKQLAAWNRAEGGLGWYAPEVAALLPVADRKLVRDAS